MAGAASKRYIGVLLTAIANPGNCGPGRGIAIGQHWRLCLRRPMAKTSQQGLVQSERHRDSSDQ